MTLYEKHCVIYESDTQPLETIQAQKYLGEINSLWQIQDKQLEREFSFKAFTNSLKFVNEIAKIAETEQHHPDIHISYNRVKIILTTHSIQGLSENDFIIAAKIDRLD